MLCFPGVGIPYRELDSLFQLSSSLYIDIFDITYMVWKEQSSHGADLQMTDLSA